MKLTMSQITDILDSFKLAVAFYESIDEVQHDLCRWNLNFFNGKGDSDDFDAPRLLEVATLLRTFEHDLEQHGFHDGAKHMASIPTYLEKLAFSRLIGPTAWTIDEDDAA